MTSLHVGVTCAALVSTWCEQLGRHLLVRHDGTMNQSHLVNGGGGGGGPTSLLPQQMQKMMPSGYVANYYSLDHLSFSTQKLLYEGMSVYFVFITCQA